MKRASSESSITTNLKETEAVAEDESALELQDQTIMEIPNDLVPIVRELIAKRRKAS